MIDATSAHELTRKEYSELDYINGCISAAINSGKYNCYINSTFSDEIIAELQELGYEVMEAGAEDIYDDDCGDYYFFTVIDWSNI